MRKRIQILKSRPMILDFKTIITSFKTIGGIKVAMSLKTERVRRKAEPLPF